MRHVVVTSVEKVDGSNSERVRCTGQRTSGSWGEIEQITFIAPEGTHHVGQRKSLPEVEGSERYP